MLEIGLYYSLLHVFAFMTPVTRQKILQLAHKQRNDQFLWWVYVNSERQSNEEKHLEKCILKTLHIHFHEGKSI